MSILALLCGLLTLSALVLATVSFLQRRQLNAFHDLAQQVQRVAIGGSLRSRVEAAGDSSELAVLATAVNHLLARSTPVPERRAVPMPAPLPLLADRVHEAVLIHRDSIVYANPQFAQFLGVAADELVGRRLEDLVPPEFTDLVGDNLRRRLSGESAVERYEIDLLGLQGQSARLELSTWVIEHDGAPALLIVGVEVFPTMSIAQPAALANGGMRSRARLALDSLVEALVTTDAQGRIDYINSAAARLLGISSERASGQSIEDAAGRLEESDRKLLAEPVKQALSGSSGINLGRRGLVIPQAAGTDRVVDISASPLRDENEGVVGAVIMLHDVTEMRGLAHQMSYQATHDALTGLVNRREFERRLQESVELSQRGDGTQVLCYLDLDRFKHINDTSGHLAGDNMLREVAKLLREAVRDSDTVARLGGDEFGMLLAGCPIDKARQIADDICRRVTDYRFVWKDKLFNIGISVGLVELARDSGSMEEVLAAADSACYVAKREGGHVAVYSARDEVFARQSGDIQWLQTLQTALRDNRFELYAQPIVPAYGLNGHGPSMEVLVRLRNEAGEHLQTIEFVRAAERYRLMGLLDRWVVQTTLTALGRGAIVVTDQHTVAINISGQTLADLPFLEFVVECFDSTGAEPSQVCFEIAENAVIANLEHAQRFIGVLHGMGCRFALDDFGSGMGSFSNLKNLAVDYLKIDGSFIRSLARDSVNQAMVTAMIRLARTMNFKVIAEQVEDAGAMEAARRMGVDYLQGYAIALPAPLLLAA